MRKRKMAEFTICFIISLLVVFGIMIIKGTIDSGFHYVDDHEFAEMQYLLSNKNFPLSKVIYSWCTNDFALRFRPLYYFFRVLLVYFFGINTVAISIVRGIVASLTLTILYLIGKELGANSYYSYLFALLSIIGYQMAAVWKMGPQENFGTLLLVIAFYLELKFLKKRTALYSCFSAFFVIIMGLYKESYIVTIPFLILYALYFEYNHNVSMKKEKKISIDSPCLKFVIALFIIMIMQIILIKVFVRGQYSNLANVEGGIINIIRHYLEVIKTEFTTDLKWYLRFGMVMIAVLLTFWEDMKKLWKEILLTLSFILPQFVLYANSGLLERYILPASIGFAAFFVIVIPKASFFHGKRCYLYKLSLILLLLAHLHCVDIEAGYFAYSGKSLTSVMNGVLEYSGKKNSKVKVMTLFSPDEEGNLTIKYYLACHGFDSVYYYHEDTNEITKSFKYDEYSYASGEDTSPIPFEDIDIVVVANEDDRHYGGDKGVDLSEFSEKRYGSMSMYVRNN